MALGGWRLAAGVALVGGIPGTLWPRAAGVAGLVCAYETFEAAGSQILVPGAVVLVSCSGRPVLLAHSHEGVCREPTGSDACRAGPRGDAGASPAPLVRGPRVPSLQRVLAACVSTAGFRDQARPLGLRRASQMLAPHWAARPD